MEATERARERDEQNAKAACKLAARELREMALTRRKRLRLDDVRSVIELLERAGR